MRWSSRGGKTRPLPCVPVPSWAMPLGCVSSAFVAKPPPLACVSTAVVRKTLPLPCVSTAFVAKPPPLACVPTAFVAKLPPLACVSTAFVAKPRAFGLRCIRSQETRDCARGALMQLTGRKPETAVVVDRDVLHIMMSCKSTVALPPPLPLPPNTCWHFESASRSGAA